MDTLELGGNIQLTGFSKLDRAQMIVLKKIIGNYGRKFCDHCSNFEQLSVTMKPVHQTESGSKYELHVQLVNDGEQSIGECTDRNLFIAVDNALRKVESNI